MITTPEPGIYENIPFNDYLAWDAINNSLLHQAKRSLAHYRVARMCGDEAEDAGTERKPEADRSEPTPSMKFGTLVHLGKLEPLALLERYAIEPDWLKIVKKPDGAPYANLNNNAIRDERKEWLAKIAPKEGVSAESLRRMRAVVESLSRHPKAIEFLECPGPVEISFLWIDQQTGLRCKGRCDKLSLSHNLIADLKTTWDIANFENSIAKFGYHRQAAFYVEGIHSLTGKLCRFGLVAAESKAPCSVRAAHLSDEAIHVGREECESLLAAIAVAQQENCWPGPESPKEWQLPQWATPKFELTFGGESFQM